MTNASPRRTGGGTWSRRAGGSPRRSRPRPRHLYPVPALHDEAEPAVVPSPRARARCARAAVPPARATFSYASFHDGGGRSAPPPSRSSPVVAFAGGIHDVAGADAPWGRGAPTEQSPTVPMRPPRRRSAPWPLDQSSSTTQRCRCGEHQRAARTKTKVGANQSFGPCLAGLQKELRLHAESCQMVWSTMVPGVKPQRASTGEAEPRKCGSIRLRLPFTALP
jgi:hypothetical protein